MEKEGLTDQVEKMELELEDQEDLLMKLQHDKNELLEQMKQASVRPDKRRLSVAVGMVIKMRAENQKKEYVFKVVVFSILN